MNKFRKFSLIIGLALASIEPAQGQVANVLADPTAAVTDRKIVAAPLTLYGFTGVSTVAGYFLVFTDRTTAPANGAVTPADCIPYPTANAPMNISYGSPALRVPVGLVITFSTTGCYSQTLSSTAFISAKYRKGG